MQRMLCCRLILGDACFRNCQHRALRALSQRVRLLTNTPLLRTASRLKNVARKRPYDTLQLLHQVKNGHIRYTRLSDEARAEPIDVYGD
jgi:hypothetical protein